MAFMQVFARGKNELSTSVNTSVGCSLNLKRVSSSHPVVNHKIINQRYSFSSPTCLNRQTKRIYEFH